MANGRATIGHKAELRAMADALYSSMGAAGYKHVVLGLIFLKYISDPFDALRTAVRAEPGLRPLLRLGGHVRAVGRVRRRARQRQRRLGARLDAAIAQNLTALGFGDD